ncbi:zinc metalloprotease HtpX [Candidatus Woesearchaeota archaeon]|nr:zinc metalloprotease HtpX [Candidatus Woesearchaeota archaeon]
MFNRLKTAMLLGLLSGLMLGAGLFIGGQTGVLIALAFAILLNFGSYWYSDKLILRMYKAKEADKKEYTGLHNIVEEVSQSAKIPKPKIYIVPSESCNAFAVGRSPKHSAIGVTKGILKLLDKNELKGVIAHEIGHIKNRDTLIATIAATIAAVISYLSVFARYFAMFGTRDRDGAGAGEILALAILTPILALIIQLAISRSREYLADRTSAKLTGQPQQLANALAKLHNSTKNNPMRIGSKTTASLFIVNPFLGGFTSIFSTHPKAEFRIKKLLEMKF